jgi:hypothetical protein
MQPVIIIITPGAVIAFTVLLAAGLALRAASRGERPYHGATD